MHSDRKFYPTEFKEKVQVDWSSQLKQYYCLNAKGYKAYKYIFYFVTDVIITNLALH